MKYLIEIQYDGKQFSGYQRQENLRTVQNEVEKALSEALKEKIEIISSSRTDAGVSAFALPAHFTTLGLVPADKVPFAVNQLLPEDVKIISCKSVADAFHARHDVKKKIYEYHMYVSPHVLPLLDDRAYQLKKLPSLPLMRKCARLLKGSHNFKGFSSVGGTSDRLQKQLYYVKLKRKGNLLTVSVCGDSFLYNMVRIIAGTLVQVGFKTLTLADVKTALQKQERKHAGFVAPAKALFLKKVQY